MANIKSVSVEGFVAKKVEIGGGIFWESAEPPPTSPYTEVPCIAATGKAYITVPGLNVSSSPTIRIDMEMMPDLTRFYHGFSGSFVGSFITNHASNYKFMLSVQEWQLGSLANSDARLRQTITYDIKDLVVTLTSSLVEGSLQKPALEVPGYTILNLFCADKYTYFGGSYLYGLEVNIAGETHIWKTVIKNESQEVGIYNEATDTFLTNVNTVGSVFVPTGYSEVLVQLSIQPDGTSDQQEQQLLAMGVS